AISRQDSQFEILACSLRNLPDSPLLSRSAAFVSNVHVVEADRLKEVVAHTVQGDASLVFARPECRWNGQIFELPATHHRRPNALKRDIANNSLLHRRSRRVGRAPVTRVQADGDRSGYIVHDQVGETDVLHLGLA